MTPGAVAGGRPSVAVFSSLLLPASETFVRAQGEALERYRAFYVGSRRVAGLSLPEDRVAVVNRGSWRGAAAEAAFKLTGMAPRLVAELRRRRPALMHAHFGPGGALALPLARRLGVPLVVTFHGADATVDGEPGRSLTGLAFRRRRRDLVREAALILAVSDFIRGRLLDRGLPPERVVRHYIGIDTELFVPGDREWSDRPPAVLFVGRLVEKKGLAYLLRAMEEVERRVEGAELWVAGDGPLRPELEREAAERLRRCRFLGMVPPAEVRELMRRARVVSVPSIRAASGDSEGFGMVFAEAQAVGTPVASFVSGGIPEAVADGETGLLAPERDWPALAAALESLLVDADLWRRMSRAGIERVRRRFSLETQTRALEVLYDRLLAGGPAGGGRCAS